LPKPFPRILVKLIKVGKGRKIMSLRIHTISKNNLNIEAVKNNWTDHAVATIREIARDWLDSNIAESVLLFFKEGLGRDLHSYMPVVSNYNGNVPKVINFPGPRGEAEIIGVDAYTTHLKLIKISPNVFQFKNDDDTFVTGTMKNNFWTGNDVFMLVRINEMPLTRESTMIVRTPVRIHRQREYQLQRYYKQINKLLRKNHQQKIKKMLKRLLLKKTTMSKIIMVNTPVSDCYDLNCRGRLVLWRRGMSDTSKS